MSKRTSHSADACLTAAPLGSEPETQQGKPEPKGPSIPMGAEDPRGRDEEHRKNMRGGLGFDYDI